jgi:pyruvate-ferredoxin/flavodoxin oxidoreductase
LLQQIQSHYPDAREDSKSVYKAGDKNPLKTFHDLPMAIRRYKDKGANFTKLSRFYVDTAFFYAHDEQEELVADPFTAVPVVPGASASFFNHSIKRNQLPVFNPRNCTGCGDCFVHCPHSALPPIVIGFEQLLKTAANIATSKGKLILKFSPVIKNLAKLAGKFIKEKDVENAQDILIPAFENLSTQMKWDGEKLEILRTEFNAILDEIGAMPMAITDTFYKLPRLISKDNGELFSLAINPSACTGCSICAQVCEEEALSMQTKDEKRESEIKHQFAIWEKLPDTSGETINRLYHDKDYSSLSALFLSRNYYMTMTGASNSELHNPYKILLHVITATAEAVVQPKIISQLKSLDKLIHDLSEQIHKKLSSALPKDNFEELSKSLRKANGEINTVEEMVQDMSAAGHDHYIDSVDLSRKVDLVEDLKKIKWTLTEGPTGVGRSRYGFLLGGAQSMDWAREFPANHFSNPLVIHWSGSAPQQSLGLFYGHLRHTIEYVKKMRQAVLEIKDGYDPETNFKEISALDWDQLTIEEKKYIPPILLIAERSDLNQGGWNDLNKLLAGNYPIKVILMDHMASSVKSSLAEINQTFSGLLSVMSTKNAFVFQGGMGDSEHLFSGLMDGMDKPFPALFNLYATKMDKHNNANLSWSLYASLVLNSRAFPSLRYDPSINGSFLSGAIELEGNRNKFKDWVEEELNVGNDDTISYKVSWADWAFTQKQWREKFEAIELKNDVILLTDFLQLDQRARKSVIPAILRGVAEGVKYYTVSPEVVEISETVLSNWNTIQELAGLRTEFPLKLKEEVEKKLQSRYLKAEAELKRKYDEQLKNQEAAQAEIMRQKLKDKLLSLSLMANRKVKS